MKNYLKIFLFLFFISFGLSSYVDKVSANEPAPAFQLKDLNDRVISLSDYKNKKAVVLIFWTTWCPYCREELKTLNQEYAGLSKSSIEVLAIDIGEPKYKVENYAKSHNIEFEVLLDLDSAVARDYDLMGVPTYFVINKSGEVVATGNSFPKNAIKELTGEK